MSWPSTAKNSATSAQLAGALTGPMLRQRAQARWEENTRQTATAGDDLTPEANRALVHELQVHQIELQMQNEEMLRARDALEESRARYVDLYDMAPVGYCRISEGGLIVQANLKLSTLLGVPRGALVNKPVSRFILREDQDIFYRLRTAVRTTDAPQSCELRMTKGDGTAFWAEWQAAAQSADSSEMWGTITDIGSRKQAEAAKLVNHTAFAAIAQGVIITGPDQLILSANAVFLAITGYAEADLIGRNCRFVQGPDTNPLTVAAIRAAIISQTDFAGEILNYRQDCTPFWNELTISPVKDPQGQLTHFVGVTRDITQRKAANQQRDDDVREKTALLKEVHHRVKNNLQVISSLLRLEAARSSVADTKAVLVEMQGRIRAMAQLHESLYRSGTFASVDLGSYLRQIATQAFQNQVLTGNKVQLLLDMGAVQVGMDQAIYCGLLVNELVSNCLKHGFPDGRSGAVSVSLQPADPPSDSTAPADALWRLQVRDTGIGLPANFEDKQRDSLGLQLIGDLSGQLGGTSTNLSQPGAGTMFHVVFNALAPVSLVMPQ